MKSKSNLLKCGLLMLGMVAAGNLAGCVVRGPGRVEVVDEHGYHHNGYYDEHHAWHGGYYDEGHNFHDDPGDWHR